MKLQKQPWRKKTYEKVTLERKLFIVDQIQNGQISTNFASKKYDVPRTTIAYWIRKYSTLAQQNNGMSKLDEIKKLKERIEELEFVKDFQQDVIADMEIITGVDMSKKSLPETLAKEIEIKKKNILKENGSISVLGLVNKPSTKELKNKKTNS
ncbi:helix-turn-helix domain-containing protein [Tenacibaculum finnmarkense]|uniref:helix-turn-helix domain-containing protein n=2 Tax=Tenacibaculum finnmarkense TaxID=2781243 RepID=UPI001E2F62DD|nr:helix-turn-helix domain-containing protein [Tenacibaculum finnmarkense]MCD8416136.1 DNA-binding protein [Tenacibaculum dicentrarchi]MCD8421250.1 DNA-binding protein [Tenacibaculum dicentrarchi]MCD8426039.1 DNA-binding protein [Tenacibaculum dicentrarchi]MCD8438410.1 DNA-binding protein [Tenacibaculum dicentrarchi]MCD8452774.1 DNA-binding protein [Tenacibaculum dicentrarchi]